MKESTVSALIVGGLIGGAILINGGSVPFGATEERREVRIMGSEGSPVGSWVPDESESSRSIHVMKSQTGEVLDIELVDGETTFSFDGTLEQLQGIDLEELEPEIREMVERLLSEQGPSVEGQEIEIRIKRRTEG
ncbi:MAG TPA: hypothetical protein DCY33_07295 [Gemmatimonadetes bacterium]|nr:hypothetical protein [Gemmatimonadota bacterium]